MSDDLDRAPSTRAMREAGVRPERLPRIYSCRHCDRWWPTIYPRGRHVRFNHSHLKVVR
jgi:hypothetical protein